jgi:GNAT superfamily N-acetyltransferase
LRPTEPTPTTTPTTPPIPPLPSASGLLVRAARPADLAVIVEFNARLADETEAKQLDRTVLARGVALALAEPERLRYWLAEARDGGAVVGQAAISREWSDWRNGWAWWFQSVYVRPDHRKQGVFRALHRQIRDQARAEADVIGLRLYVETANDRALRTYEALGFTSGGYRVYEELWPERFDRAD